MFLSQTTGFQWPRDLALHEFYVDGKIWPPTGSFSKIIALKRSAPIKKYIANVNHVIFGRIGRVYLYLSWLTLRCRDPEAAERTETKFSLIHSVTALLHFSKHIISLVSCEKRTSLSDQYDANELWGVLADECWALQIRSQVVLMI